MPSGALTSGAAHVRWEARWPARAGAEGEAGLEAEAEAEVEAGAEASAGPGPRTAEGVGASARSEVMPGRYGLPQGQVQLPPTGAPRPPSAHRSRAGRRRLGCPARDRPRSQPIPRRTDAPSVPGSWQARSRARTTRSSRPPDGAGCSSARREQEVPDDAPTWLGIAVFYSNFESPQLYVDVRGCWPICGVDLRACGP